MDVDNKPSKIDMNHFSIKIAGIVIGIDTLSTGTYAYCLRYLSDESPKIRVSITEEEIEQEIERNKKSGYYINEIYLESIAIYRKIAEALLEYNAFLIHGAAIAHNEDGFIFTAASGTGKTTHIKQWLEKDINAYVINGDKPLIKLTENEAIVCGTPWNGKERMGTNKMVPLKAIVILERSAENHIEELHFGKAYQYLLQHVHRPADPIRMKKTLDLLAQLYGKVRVFKFYINNFREDCFKVAYEALVSE